MGALIFITLMALGYFAGRAAERAHFTRLDNSEAILGTIFETNLKTPPASAGHSELVTGNVVVALDYFKMFTSSIRILFGGRMKAYDPLMERARREAVVRMKQQAFDMGASSVYNVRLETSRIGNQHTGKGIGAVEIFAYGTAIIESTA